jgi:tetratricopeptide (TPR) repeat protein
MTATLTHPAAENLGRFIEGTLEEPERAAVVEHVADCDDCRIIVVDASEFFAKEHLIDDQPVLQHNVSGRWWMAAAAAVAIAVAGVGLVDARRDPLAPVINASSKLHTRLVAARLSGFSYVAPKRPLRGGKGDTDPGVNQVAVEADEVLHRRGDNARMQHAKGVAGLLLVEAELADRDDNDTSDQSSLFKERKAAIDKLQSAANEAPDNAAYLSDLAAALMANGDPQSLVQALAACNKALQVDRRSADALFNRAKVLDLMARTPSDQTDVVNAYSSYIDVDPSSPWANEARQRIKYLTEELKTQP